MKVSIITICYNRKATIANAIDSVLSQDYPDLEYIIIDGNSKDGTKEIVASYGDKIDVFVSESDKGMYDALNKGLALATGDIIGLMHSDDAFYEKNVLSKIVQAMKKNPEAQGLYGDGIYVSNDEEERLIRNRIGGEYSIHKIKSGWLPLHPTVYLQKKVIAQYGSYNLDFKIASDTEFLLRYLYKYSIKMIYLNTYIVKMRMGGLSTNPSDAWKVLIEDYKIYSYHQLFALKVVFLKKMLALKQYILK